MAAAPNIEGTVNSAEGYGVPTSASLTTNLPGTAATLAQVGGTLAQLIIDLKSKGIIEV